jgi:hypothetical protein
VNPRNIEAMRDAMHKRAGQPGYSPAADLNHDGVIDEKDIALLKRTPAPPPNQPRTR